MAQTGRRRYAISSLFLHESFKKLTADNNEQFFFVTGTEIDGVMVLDQWAEFEHQKRTMLGVTAKATHRVLIKLEQFGHRLLAHFHSHQGNGAGATSPSGTDQNFQQRLESAGHAAVMAIFSRDGFVRFVRLDDNFDIEIFGHGVEKHAPATSSQTSIRLRGTAIPGAEERQKRIAGFDQAAYSQARVVCIGAGGIVSHIASTLVRKGIGAITLFDSDIVEASNLNRQRFYAKDIGKNKAVALAENLQPECIASTELTGFTLRVEEAIGSGIDLCYDVAICGVDNNPSRVAAACHFRTKGIPVIFAAVSQDGDHGYVFVQEATGPCIGCLFPDMADDDRYPCPGTPAIADILQMVGAMTVYAVDTLLMNRSRSWNYRTFSLSDGGLDGASFVPVREGCRMPGGALH